MQGRDGGEITEEGVEEEYQGGGGRTEEEEGPTYGAAAAVAGVCWTRLSL